MAALPSWNVTAIRYATYASSRADQFYRYEVYREPDGPMDLDYFFWLLDDGTSKVLVDTGFHPDAIKTRPGRELVIPPVEALAELGVEPSEVSTVVVSHCHYDHIGNLSAFPDARFVVQRREMEFWTGPHRNRPAASASVEAKEIDFMAEALRNGRVDLIDGAATIAPGIEAELVGGHCPGQQVIRVEGDRFVVLCSDALHFEEEMHRYMPFNVFFELEGMYRTYDRLRSLREGDATIVAGHDPAVMTAFPAVAGFEGMAVKVG